MAVTQRPESTAVEKLTPKKLSALVVSDWGRSRLEAFVPKGMTLDQIGQIIAIEARKVPALLECDPVSLIESTARVLSWGLIPGETAFLVPFGRTCQPIKGAEGLIQLMYDSGHVRAVDARVVYAGEHFKIEQGLHPVLEHHPSLTAKERGEIVGAYCIIRLPFQNFVMEFFPADYIEQVRQGYSKQWKKGPLPAWYARKTAIIHTAKLLPKNSKFAAVHDAVRREEAEAPQIDAEDAEILETTTEPSNDRRISPAAFGEYGEDA